MFIPELQRHLAICGANEVEQFIAHDPKFWNIVSIYEPWDRRRTWGHAKKIHYACFHDAEAPGEGIRIPSAADIEGIFQFIDGCAREGILIHCLAGQSRSTAVALALIARGLIAGGIEPIVEPAVSYLLQIRRVARPNALVLEMGLGLFLDSTIAKKLAANLLNHPRLLENRFLKRPGLCG